MAKRRMGIMAFLLSLFLCFMPCLALAVSTTEAKEHIDINRECSLTLSYRSNGITASGKSVELYQIAEVSTSTEYTLVPSFASTGLILNGIQTNGEWNIVRSTLEAYILADKVVPTKTAVVDESGQVDFDGLKPGLYLVSAVRADQNGWRCSFDSALIALPGLHTDGLWQYDVTANLKSEAIPPSSSDDDDEIEFKILKLWKEGDGHKERPVSVEVEIFRNGYSYKTVILSEKNHWAYSWIAEDDDTNWKVVERNIPEGYVMTLEERGTVFVLTNTLTTEEPPDVPVVPGEPSEEPPETEEPPLVLGVTDITEIKPSEEESSLILGATDMVPQLLPQTGDTSNALLYILLMFGSGSMLIILGITEKRSRHEEKE